ncbi:MAG: excinuclease ABC subunit C [Elusimicrobia bacterium CG08_land_8_20_14_0_20_51_18]|nr:MAG: excinuclease ABC subunit C [Elusimicrobia bacterium CG08_land_8_20_14_0_20_51_18]
MDLSHIPHSPGVYLMRDASFSIIYIGKAKVLKNRVSQYFSAGADKTWKTSSIKLLVRQVEFIPCESEREALLLERELIKKYQPFFNRLWKDSKTYPYVKITREDFPRLFLTRRKTGDGGFYFGPYPKVELVKKTLSYMTSIKLLNLRKCKYNFSEKEPLNKGKIIRCIYYHTRQCPAPCDPRRISKKDYASLAGRAVDFFRGAHAGLIEEFRKEMKKASGTREYEKAALYRDFISSLEHISEKVLVKEISRGELGGRLEKAGALKLLKELLSLPKLPAHIETFDTSSLFGRNAVGSSVCFVNGRKNHSHYRRYKIRLESPLPGSDDFRMIHEIVYRRLKSLRKAGTKLPDLLVIDGGKGQLGMALKAAAGLKLKTAIVSLAKKFEEIFIPGRETPLALEKDNPALRLLQEMRDEAHRFGVTFHKKLRDKDLFI